jgi:thioredoxin-like negative regulator of GroEL
MVPETQDSLIGSGAPQPWEAPFRRVVGSLLQTCLVAARNGFHDDAEDILASVEAARPEHSSPKYARALLLLYKCKPDEAEQFLEEKFLRADPGDDMARALACMAYHAMERDTECFHIVRDLVHNGRNEQAVAIARSLAADLKFAV